MLYRKRSITVEGETLEERKDAAAQAVGRKGVFVVRPDGSIEALEVDQGDKPRVVKASKRPLPKPKAGAELVTGYEAAAVLAERRAERCWAWSEGEAKEYLKVARYCHMMATYRLTDDPVRSQTAYNIDWVDEAVLSEIQSRQPDPERWNADRQMALDAALLLLSERERVVVTMYYGSDMRQRDIAQALEITQQRVAECIEFARKKWALLRTGGKIQGFSQG